MSEKSVLEQALLQINTLEEAVKQNAKSIIASTMKQELSDLLKESLEEEEETADAVVPEEEEEEKDMSDLDSTEDETADDEEAGIDDEEDSEENDELPSISDETADDEETDVDADMNTDTDFDSEDAGDDLPSIDDMDSDDDTLDMTNASDEEVLKVFKAMKDEDGIVVKKDDVGNIELSAGDDDYIIKLNEEEEEDAMADDSESDMAEEEDTIYEIELDEEDEESADVTPGVQPKAKEVEAMEAARSFATHKRGNGGTQFKAGSKGMNTKKPGAINEEFENLKKQNAEYKKALVMFKDKLNEVAVFNANLAYATRLFTEHSTTKSEKLEILKRFDTISSINESKNLYSQIKTELGTKKPVTEAVADKIASNPTTSSSEVLSEAKVYEAPQFARMKDLMKKIK
jgi:hypothetical protein